MTLLEQIGQPLPESFKTSAVLNTTIQSELRSLALDLVSGRSHFSTHSRARKPFLVAKDRRTREKSETAGLCTLRAASKQSLCVILDDVALWRSLNCPARSFQYQRPPAPYAKALRYPALSCPIPTGRRRCHIPLRNKARNLQRSRRVCLASLPAHRHG